MRDDTIELDARFTELVERQSRFVFQIAYAVLRNVQDAEDTVQELFLKLYRTGTWRDVRDEKAFLARAVWRIALDKRPKKRHAAGISEPVSKSESPETMLMNSTATAQIHQLMDSLPADLRQPLALSTIQELTSRDIAAILSIPEGTVRRRIMRARQILREKFERFKGTSI